MVDSTITSSSRATAVGVGNKNLVFVLGGGNLKRKVNVVATYDPLKTSVNDEVPVEILSEADAGNRFGFGFPMHKIIEQAFAGGATTVYATPQSEAGGAVASQGDITWTGTTTKAGTIYLRIGGKLYPVQVASGSGPEAISDAIVAFVNAIADVQVTVATTAITFETVFTAKGKGPEGDNITLTLNELDGEEFPAGIVSGVIQDMGVVVAGSGLPDIQDALDGMGTGDDANELRFTHLVHGYGLDTTTADKVSAYVGEGNDFVGCYGKLVNRPFVCVNVDTAAGSAGYTALKAITDARLEDRANIFLGCPGEKAVPTEMAGFAAGKAAIKAEINPAENIAKQIFQREGKSVSTDRWTKNYSTGRDAAVNAGISPTRVRNETLYFQNLVTTYRPTSIPTASNAFSSARNINIITDFGAFIESVFDSEDWTGITIVKDKAKVTDSAASLKARDESDVQTQINAIIDFGVSKGWIYDGDWAKENSTFAIRSLSNGFDILINWQLPGESQVYNVQSGFDINIAA
jgi:phage tail sheath gpL-like